MQRSSEYLAIYAWNESRSHDAQWLRVCPAFDTANSVCFCIVGSLLMLAPYFETHEMQWEELWLLPSATAEQRKT